jgi:hypothetical protein
MLLELSATVCYTNGMNENDLANVFKLDKRVYVEFINADADGYVLDSDEGPPLVRHFVKQLYVYTDEGTVGKCIHAIPFFRILKMLCGQPVPTQYKDTNHEYTVVSKMEEGNEVWLRVKHSVREPEPPTSN